MLPQKTSLPLLAALACLLTAAIYAPGMRGEFALDDYTNIVQNNALEMADLSWDSVSHAVLSFQAGPSMRALSMLSFALNVYFTGMDPLAFKVTNLAIHLVNGLLAMFVIWHLLSAFRSQLSPGADAVHCAWLALICGALWMVHPLNAMPVLYVVQREAALSGCFVLIGIIVYTWVRQRQLSVAGAAGPWVLWLGLPCITLLAVLSKESGALLPLYALVVETFIFRFRSRSGGLDRTLVFFYALVLLLPAAAGFTWLLVGHGSGFVNFAGRDFNMGERLMSEARAIWLYVRWTLLPYPSTLGLYHDDFAVSRGLLQPPTTLLSLVGITGLVAACRLLYRRLPLVALGLAWFLGGQLMESTIFPLELVYEHRCYIPDLGLLLALVSLLYPLESGAHFLRARYAVLGLMFTGFAAVTWVRAYDWRDNLHFAQSEARHHPQSPYATYMLGQTYANLALMKDKNEYDDAVAALRAASAVENSTVIPDVSLVLVEAQLRGTVDADVLPRIAAKLRERKPTASDIQGLAALGECVEKGNCVVPHPAIQAVFDAVFANPHLAVLPDTHANILVICGNYTAYADHDIRKARGLMAQAAALVPREPQYRQNMIIMDISMRDPVLAAQDLQALRQLNYLGHLDAVIDEFESEIAGLPRPTAPQNNP